MDRGPSEYAQSDHTSAASYTPQPDARSANLSSSNTPQSDYGLTPASARSQTFPPDHLARYPHYQPGPHPQSAIGSMAQPASPSMSLPDAPPHDARVANHMKSDPDVPIDPSIAQQQQQSPTYPPPYSPYNPQAHEMAQYQGHPPPGMYQPRPDGWGGQYGHPAHMQGPYQSPATSVPNASPNVTAGGRPGQVYSFVPIPGAQQHKRPRRRYEEIERMYKCGWQGCEKAYGTLNHLNAHVTMQSHGNKRTPEEFKEIRKEWKQRKKEEENQRKQQEERERTANGPADGQAPDQAQQGQAAHYAPGVRPSLPPIGYAPADGQVPSQYPGQQSGMVYQQGNGQMGYPPANSYPHSPYAQGNPQYAQQPAPQANHSYQ